MIDADVLQKVVLVHVWVNCIPRHSSLYVPRATCMDHSVSPSRLTLVVAKSLNPDVQTSLSPDQVRPSELMSIILIVLLYICLFVFLCLVASVFLDAFVIFGPGRRVPKSYSGCCSCCFRSCYQFSNGPKIPMAFLIRSRAQRNLYTHSCWHCPQIYRLRFFTYFLINE